MTLLTKSAIAAAILAVMAGAAHAQTGPSRQIQVLPAPSQAQVAQAAPQAAPEEAAPATNGAAAEAEPAQPEAQSPAPKAAPEARPAPKFAPVPPKFVAPKRPVYAEGYGHESYGYASYGYAPKRYRNHCH